MFAALAPVWCKEPAPLLITSGNAREAVVSSSGMFGCAKYPHHPDALNNEGIDYRFGFHIFLCRTSVMTRERSELGP